MRNFTGGLVFLVLGCTTINQHIINLKMQQESWITVYEKIIPGEGTYSIFKNNQGHCFLDFEPEWRNGLLDYNQRSIQELWEEPEVIRQCYSPEDK